MHDNRAMGYPGIVSDRSLRASTRARSQSIISRPEISLDTGSVDRSRDGETVVTVEDFL
jgi:hypothetical protein